VHLHRAGYARVTLCGHGTPFADQGGHLTFMSCFHTTDITTLSDGCAVITITSLLTVP